MANTILAPAGPERNPRKCPWDTPSAAIGASFSPCATYVNRDLQVTGFRAMFSFHLSVDSLMIIYLTIVAYFQ
jgi:hypothetical protein